MTDCFTYKIHLLMVCRLACVKNEKCIFCFSFLYLLDSVGFNNSLLRSICCVTKLISWLPMNLSCCSFCILVFSAFVVTSVFFFSQWCCEQNFAIMHIFIIISAFFHFSTLNVSKEQAGFSMLLDPHSLYSSKICPSY